jgi:hypothetical protein
MSSIHFAQIPNLYRGNTTSVKAEFSRFPSPELFKDYFSQNHQNEVRIDSFIEQRTKLKRWLPALNSNLKVQGQHLSFS